MEERDFDPIVRAAEKQRFRDEDELALRDGNKTREQLREENGLFVFANVLIDFDGAEELGP